MEKYVVGFLIDTQLNVVLIRKNKPQWQAGKLNGVGGKIEENESAYDAMVREFSEEAGIIFTSWNMYAKLTEQNKYDLFVFRGFVESVKEIEVKSMTNEIIEVHNIKNLYNEFILPSAMWLLHMALQYDANFSDINFNCTNFNK